MSNKPTLLQIGKLRKAPNTIPIDYIVNFIQNVKPSKPGDHFIIIKAGTGSGKSTIIPPQIYTKLLAGTAANIAITQPRVLTAVDIPKIVVEFNPTLKMGYNIGYQTGPIKKRPISGLIFMTVGTLVQQIKIMDPLHFISKYRYIIVDEIHERDISVDMLLFYLKNLSTRHYDHPNFPIILFMSATLDEKPLVKYFKIPKTNILEVAGQSYPILQNFSKFQMSNYIHYAIYTALKIHITTIDDERNDKLKDILIFVKGTKEVKDMIGQISDLNDNILHNRQKTLDYVDQMESEITEVKGGKANPPNDYLLPVALTSENYKKSGKEYRNLFANIDTLKVPIKMQSKISYVTPSRRIIVSTNVAETGVTIDTLKYCIDTGYVKNVEYNPTRGCHLLIDRPLTLGMAKQRRGRVGRKGTGYHYPCYTKDTWEALQVDKHPDIFTTDPSPIILSNIIEQSQFSISENGKFKIHKMEERYIDFTNKSVFNLQKLDFLESPASHSIAFAVEKLYILGYINAQYEPTLFGYYANKIKKVSLENIRLILASYHNQTNTLDMITIAAFLSAGWQTIGTYRNKYTPLNPNGAPPEVFEKQTQEIGCEFVEYLFIWEMFMNQFMVNSSRKVTLNKVLEWCAKHKFKYEGILKVIEIRDEIIEILISIGLNPFYKKAGNLLTMISSDYSEALKYISRIKKCILDAYRLNTATLNPVTKKYYADHWKYELSIDSKLIKKYLPKHIVFATSMLKPSFGYYGFSVDTISFLIDPPDLDLIR